MPNQFVTATFENAIPSGYSFELSDENGIHDSGQISSSTSTLTMNVTFGLPLDHQYTLKFYDEDSVQWSGAKLLNAVGGIVIVENVDI